MANGKKIKYTIFSKLLQYRVIFLTNQQALVLGHCMAFLKVTLCDDVVTKEMICFSKLYCMFQRTF